MAAHPTLVAKLDQMRKTQGSTAHQSTVAAANNTFDSKELQDIIHTANAVGYEVVLNAGVLTIQPRQ